MVLVAAASLQAALAEAAASQLRAAVDGYEKAEGRLEKVREWRQTLICRLAFGPDFDEAIICLACSKIQLETGQTEGTNFYQLYQDEVKSLKKTNVDKIDYASMLKRGGQSNRFDPMISPTLSYRQTGLAPVVG